MIDYDIYIMSIKEKILYFLLASIVVFAVAYLFYRSFIVSAVISLLALYYPKIRTRQIILKRKKRLLIQFKDLLYSLSVAVSSSKSLENAVRDSYNDLLMLYVDEQTEILQEISQMIRKMGTNSTINELFKDFAERSHIDDIENFSDILNTIYGKSSNFAPIIRNTASTISEKIEIMQEIETTISGKKFEARVMSVLPIVMMLVLSLSAADYMEPVFTTLVGHVSMTIAIVIFLISAFISERISNIEV